MTLAFFHRSHRAALRVALQVCACAIGVLAGPVGGAFAGGQAGGEVGGEVGRAGGALVVSLRAEPKTLNPVIALDAPSREVMRRLHADLMSIDRDTLQPRPELAERVETSPDGKRMTVTLRRDLRFSDGVPCTADDVVFTFQSFLDERFASPQRELLIVGGRPLAVRKLDARRVVFEFAAPYAPAERLFDGVPVLPMHVLGPLAKDGSLASAWGLGADPRRVVGLGPFRLREYVAGQRIVLERNPHYFRRDARGQPLPYLDTITFVVVANEDAQVARLKAGEVDVIGRLSPSAAVQLEAAGPGVRVHDGGPSLEYNFLLLNLNPIAAGTPDASTSARAWWADARVRRALSLAVDRDAMVRLVYYRRATAIGVPVSPANTPWFNTALGSPRRDLAAARALLEQAGSRLRDGKLLDPGGRPVGFSIAVAANNAPRRQMATMLADDLKAVGIAVTVVPLEFRALVDRVTRSFDFDAAVMGLASGDVDPAADLNVWKSTGATHLWRMDQSTAPPAWEAEIDRLMEAQLVTRDTAARKRSFDRVQVIAAEQMPVVPLVSPHLVSAFSSALGNVRPSILDSSAIWNAGQIYWREGPPASRR